MERSLIEKKMRVYLIIVSAIFGILVLRLAYMQLLQNDRYSTLARENRIRLITITAPAVRFLTGTGLNWSATSLFTQCLW
jgi:penicillin-binding protein 2